MKKSLLVIAHGSRVESSNNEVRDLIDSLNLSEKYQFIEVAFLDCAIPTITEGLEHCLEVNSTDIYVFYYFLVAGKHIKYDIPDKIEQFTLHHPNISIHYLGYLGDSPYMPNLLQKILS